MKLLLGTIAALAASAASAGTVGYSLCNEFGVQDVTVLVRDKKNGMSVVYNGSVAKNQCLAVSSSSGNGDHAEVEVRVGQGTPYGVPWIRPGDKVKF